MATVEHASSGRVEGMKAEARRTNSDGSKSASELYSQEAAAETKQMPWEPITEIDKKDVGTPDQWIPRHPDLIRLTGRCLQRESR